MSALITEAVVLRYPNSNRYIVSNCCYTHKQVLMALADSLLYILNRWPMSLISNLTSEKSKRGKSEEKGGKKKRFFLFVHKKMY